MSHSQVTTSANGKRKRTREAPSSFGDEAAALLEHSVDEQFASYKRTEVAARHPQWSAQRVTTEIRRQWKNMTPTEQQPWIELSNFDKERAPQEPAAPVVTETIAEREVVPSKRSKARDEPRQPDTPYICFWKYARPEVVAMYPTLSAPNVSKEVGARWRELSEEERQEWKDLAALDRHRYEKEMAAYRKTKAQATKTPIPATAPSAAATPSIEENSPKPPKTGFQCFLSHNRESLALLNMTMDEFREEMSELWQRMDPEDKQVWLDLAAQDRRRYETEMVALKRPVDTELTKKRLDELKAKAKSMAHAPPLPQTAYSFFSTAKRQEILQQKPKSKLSDVNREASRLWKAMDAYEKLPFITQAQSDVERFVRSMEAIEAEEGDVDNAWAADLLLPGSTTVSAPATSEIPIVAPNGRWRRKANAATPRKPMNAFNMMYLAKREELMATYQLTQNECSALCGRMWRQMPESERKPYHDMAKQDKERYTREMRELTPSREPAKAPKARSSTWEAPAPQADLSLLESADEDSSFDELRRLEQSARAVFESPLYEDDDGDGVAASRPRQMTPGFMCFVQSKCSERGREHWTSPMWLTEWSAMAAPHRVLWEELAVTKPHGHSSSGSASPSFR